MFSIKRKTENGFDKVILTDDSTNTTAEIIPSCSAILHAFTVDNQGTQFNVIDSYASGTDFKENLMSAGFKGSKLSPFVCRTKDATYSFAGEQYTLTKNLRGKDALHGELFDKAFEITGEIADASRASLTMKYHYDKEDPGYPFTYACQVTWQLEPNNQLRVTTECTNLDDGLIPMQDGWHPYFDLGDKIDELHLEFQSMEMVEFENLIPNGKMQEYETFNSLKKIGATEFDNCFTLNLETCQPMCVLRNESKNIQVELHPDKSYPYLQIYSPPHRNSIAIENLSGTPDGFNNGMGVITLEPGQSVKYEVVYKVVLLKENI